MTASCRLTLMGLFQNKLASARKVKTFNTLEESDSLVWDDWVDR